MNKTKSDLYSFSAITGIITGVILAILGIILITFMSLMPKPNLVTAGQEAPSSGNNVYDMGQVLVIDKYGYVEYTSSVNEDYYLIAYYTEDGTAHLASLMVSEDKSIFAKMNDYVEDDTAYVGDFYINLCAKAEPLNSIDPELVQYYNDAIATYSDYLTGIEDSHVALSFYCEGAEAFPAALEEHNSQMSTVKIIGGVIIAVGIIAIVISIFRLNKAKKLKAQMAQQGVYFNPANQPNVYYNPQMGANPWNNSVPYQQPQNGANQWNNNSPYQQPQNGVNQWNNNPPYQQPQNGADQWGGSVQYQQPQVNIQPDSANTNQYYTPPTENKATYSTNVSEDTAQNNQQ